MGILTGDQLQNGYFKDIGGFPPTRNITAISEHDGSKQCGIWCTQLQGRYSDAQSRKILKEWIGYLRDHPTAFHALHFNSRVPQALLDAICCQTELTELRIKCGSFSDLSRLAHLKKLRYLYLGSSPSVTSLSPLPELDELLVLYIEYFKRTPDMSPLKNLQKLEQLTISGPILDTITIQDIDFIREMPALSSVRFTNVRTQKSYTPQEWELFRSLNIQGIYDHLWWTCI